MTRLYIYTDKCELPTCHRRTVTQLGRCNCLTHFHCTLTTETDRNDRHQ